MNMFMWDTDSELSAHLFLTEKKIRGLRALPFLSKRKAGALKRLVNERLDILDEIGSRNGCLPSVRQLCAQLAEQIHFAQLRIAER